MNLIALLNKLRDQDGESEHLRYEDGEIYVSEPITGDSDAHVLVGSDEQNLDFMENLGQELVPLIEVGECLDLIQELDGDTELLLVVLMEDSDEDPLDG